MAAMRFCLLGSGSGGNATLVEKGQTRILIDSGFSLKELEQRLQRSGIEVQSLSAVVVTHEHNDHIGGIGPLARRYKLPVWMTRGSYRGAAQRLGKIPELHFLNCHQPFAIGELELTPFPVPHDAEEPCQFTFGDGVHRLGVLTDCGSSTPHIEQQLSGCDALILECNHDSGMLANGPYPPSLQARVGGPMGHLSNSQAAAIARTIDTSRLQHLVAAHLSEKNNRPQLAANELAEALGCGTDWIALAGQEWGLDWREIG